MVNPIKGSRTRPSRSRVCAKVIAAAAVTSLAFSACGTSKPQASKGDATSFPTEDVALKLWWWGGDDAKGLALWLDKAAADYKIKHPNVTIVPVEQTTDGLLPAFQAAAEAKQGPDIQYFWGGIWGVSNAWKDAILPISDYISKEELSHYVNTAENTYKSKVWTAPFQLAPSFPVMYRKDAFAKLNVQIPSSWDDMIKACDAFHAAGDGQSLFAGGIKDGWFGGWLWTIIGQQQLASVGELMDASVGANDKTMSDPAVSEYWKKLEEMHTHNCWNKDIGSVALYEGQQAWRDGKAGITVNGNVQEALISAGGGEKNIVVGTMPVWGSGPYAKRIGSSSQTLGVTSWSKYPQVGADFIKFLHEPEQMLAQWTLSRTYPSDDRFDTANFNSKLAADVVNITKAGGPYLENFIPTELDADGIIKHTQLVLTGNESAADAIKAVQAVADRLKETRREQTANFATWAESFR